MDSKKDLTIVSCLLAIALVIVCSGMIGAHNNLESSSSQLATAQRMYREQLKTHHHKQKVIHKTVASSYKKMMKDGHVAAKDENQILQYLKAHYKHSTAKEIDDQSNTAASRNLSGYLTNYDSSNGISSVKPWTFNFNNHIKFIPGTVNSDGMYNCAFLIFSSGHHYDTFITATYDPHAHVFDDAQYYGDIPNKKAMQKQLKSKKIRHVTRKAIKKQKTNKKRRDR